MHTLIQRWDALIAEVLGRFDVILAKASAASQPLLENVVDDLSQLTLPWTAVEQQKHRYGEEISDGWDEVSDQLSEVGGLPEGVMDQQGKKRDQATCELAIRYQRAYSGVMAAAADRMRAHALAADARRSYCPSCGAAMDRVNPVSQALNVECPYCNALVSVEPGAALRMFASGGALFLGEREAFPAWEAMTRAETQMKQYRNRKDVPLELLQHYEAAARAYWTTRLTVETSFVPEQAPYLESKVQRYVGDVHKQLRGYWQWRQAQAG
jgi:hypothetical protein